MPCMTPCGHARPPRSSGARSWSKMLTACTALFARCNEELVTCEPCKVEVCASDDDCPEGSYCMLSKSPPICKGSGSLEGCVDGDECTAECERKPPAIGHWRGFAVNQGCSPEGRAARRPAGQRVEPAPTSASESERQYVAATFE